MKLYKCFCFSSILMFFVSFSILNHFRLNAIIQVEKNLNFIYSTVRIWIVNYQVAIITLNHFKSNVSNYKIYLNRAFHSIKIHKQKFIYKNSFNKNSYTKIHLTKIHIQIIVYSMSINKSDKIPLRKIIIENSNLWINDKWFVHWKIIICSYEMTGKFIGKTINSF